MSYKAQDAPTGRITVPVITEMAVGPGLRNAISKNNMVKSQVRCASYIVLQNIKC